MRKNTILPSTAVRAFVEIALGMQCKICQYTFLWHCPSEMSIFIGPRCPWGPIYGSGSLSPFADLTDLTLVDEDTKSTLTDNANRAIQGNQAMHVTWSGVQIC